MITIIIISAVLVYVAYAGVSSVIEGSKELGALKRGLRFQKKHQSNLKFRSRQIDDEIHYRIERDNKEAQQRATKDKHLKDKTRKLEKRAMDVMENMDWTDE